jgi:GxxExxY protein
VDAEDGDSLAAEDAGGAEVAGDARIQPRRTKMWRDAGSMGICEGKVVPVVYGKVTLEVGYRLDLLVDDLVVVEIKAIEALQPIHTAQLLSYLRLLKRKLGYLLNFNVAHMRNGIKRVVNGL